MRGYLGYPPILPKVQALFAARDGGVPPAEHVVAGHAVHTFLQEEEHIAPLAALRFVAGNGVAESGTEAIEVIVFLHGLFVLVAIGRGALAAHAVAEVDH